MEENNSLKNLFLALVGGTAMTYERAQALTEQMIEKGKVSVAEGKELSEDLKKTFQNREATEHKAAYENELFDQVLSLRQDLDKVIEDVAKLKEAKETPKEQ